MADGIGSGVQPVRGDSRRGVVVNTHVGEVVTEQRRHLVPDTGVERAAGVAFRLRRGGDRAAGKALHDGQTPIRPILAITQSVAAFTCAGEIGPGFSPAPRYAATSAAAAIPP